MASYRSGLGSFWSTRYGGRTSVGGRVVLALCLLVGAPAWAGFSGTDVFLPSVGAGAGSGTSVWYTTVWVHNPGSAPADVQFTFLLRDQANVGSPWVYNDRIQPGDTHRYPNAMETLFGLTSRMFGAIRVQASERVIVNGRIYSKEQGKEERDSTGQFFAGVPAAFAIGAGERTQLLGVSQSSPQSSSEYRYNFGFVEAAGGDAFVEVSVVDETGSPLMTKSYSLRPYEPKQYNITDILPAPTMTNAAIDVTVRTNSTGKVVVFGSGIANRSNDPSTFEMAFKDSLLAGSGGGELTLPYEGSASTVGPAFKVTNSGSSGTGVHGVGGSGVAGYGVVGQSDEGSGVRGEAGPGLGVEGMALSGDGVRGLSTSGKGVSGYTDAGGAGVYGVGGATSGKPVLGSPGVWGDSSASAGVWGTSNSAAGVAGQSTTNAGIAGVTASGYGVRGISTDTSADQGTAYGGHFLANGAEDVGVYGESTWAGGSGDGGSFRTAARHGKGVRGVNSATEADGNGEDGEAAGVYGRTSAESGSGVFGVNALTGAVGMLGHSDSGVFGINRQRNYEGGVGNWLSGAYGTFGNVTAGYLGRPMNGVEGFTSLETTNASGVYGETVQGATNGVYGLTRSNTDAATGVFGEHQSIYGTARGAGVWGRTNSVNGWGGRFENRGGGVALWAGKTDGVNGDVVKVEIIDGGGATVGTMFRVHASGNVYARGSFFGGGADVAERIDVDEHLEPGDVVEIDAGCTNRFRRSSQARSTLVAGVVSTLPGLVMNSGEAVSAGAPTDSRPALALVGQVPVKATTEGGPIRVGDLMVSSSSPGHAMRCAEPSACAGAIIGKALEPLETESGRINMLVTLQ